MKRLYPTRLGVVSSKGIRVLVVMAVTVAFTGYFVGLRESRQSTQSPRLLPVAPSPDARKPVSDVALAPRYADLSLKKLGPNRDWHSSLATLVQPESAGPPAKAPTTQQREECLAERSARRAFEGAPPVIPHPTLGTASCLACHEKGLVIGDRVARQMSHPHYANCTQCHVEARPAELSTLPVVARPTERAFSGAPPTLPHPVWMRESCLSCHGPTGHPGLRTTHPERQSCLQCHAPTSAHDRVPHTVLLPKETP